MWRPLLLLFSSNIFMTIAWYGHTKNFTHTVLWKVILISWGIAFFEYCLQIPANRIGLNYFNLPQLKVIQEIFSMGIFFLFSVTYLKIPITKNFFYASLCLVLAAFFMFKDRVG